MSFYKVKKEWDKQHRTYMKQLKDIYEQALKDKKNEEKSQDELLKILADKIKEKQAIVKILSSRQANIEEAIVAKEGDLKRAQAEIDKAELKLINERAMLKAASETLDKEKREFSRYKREQNERITERKEGLKQTEESTSYTISKNEALLKKIRLERDSIDRQRGDLERNNTSLAKRQEEFDKEKRSHKGEIDSIKLLRKQVDSGLKHIAEQKKKNEDLNKALTAKQKVQDTKDQDQSDRDLEQNLRDAELNRKERRIENLIQLNKIK